MRKSGKILGCCLITVSLLACTACSGFDRLSDNLKDGAEQLSDDVVIGKSNALITPYQSFEGRPRVAKKLVDGKYVKYILYPQLGEKARNNGHCVYSLDFEVTPHQLRHTYITNLIHSSVDPKTVQYLAGHESSKITMDIYAKVKYNQPDQVVKAMDGAFAQWDAMWA